MRRTLAALAAAAVLSAPMAAAPAETFAANNQTGNGLVVLQIGNIKDVVDVNDNDILTNTTVQLAANVCGVTVDALVDILSDVDAAPKNETRTICTTGGQTVSARNR